MAFPKFHGITLANNSWIENAHFERLSADPVPASAGRIWFNTTEKKLKFSGIDGTGAVAVYAFASATELAAALAEAKAYSDTVKQEILGGIPPATLDTITEIAAALENNPDIVSVLRQFSSDAVAAAKAEIRGAVSGAFDTLEEIETALARIDGADTVSGSFRKVVLDEANARSTADTELTNKVGTLTSLTTTAKGNLVAAINELDADLTTEVNARVDAVSSLDTRVTTVEGQVNGKIGDLSSLTTTAKSTIVAAVNELDADLATEVSAREAAVNSLQGAIDAEATARGNADTALKTAINAKQYTFVASSAALSHTITHGLDAQHVLFSIMVEGADGKYRNDIVPVEEIDTNSFKIDLAEARRVKVSVQALTALV